MSGALLVGVGPWLVPVPAVLWRGRISSQAKKAAAQVALLGEEARRVRELAVLEIARTGRPVPPAALAERLGLGLDRVVQILEDLDRRLVYLHRDSEGAVEWAYPVTAARTSHRLVLDDGTEVRAA